VAALAANGTAYQVMLANDSSDYANVTVACNEANDKVRSINNTSTGYEQDYQARLGLKTNASAAFDLAVDRSRALYDAAWNYMQQNGDHLLYGDYLVYLRACDQNGVYVTSYTIDFEY
jgi:hypothetical protein